MADNNIKIGLEATDDGLKSALDSVQSGISKISTNLDSLSSKMNNAFAGGTLNSINTLTQQLDRLSNILSKMTGQANNLGTALKGAAQGVGDAVGGSPGGIPSGGGGGGQPPRGPGMEFMEQMPGGFLYKHLRGLGAMGMGMAGIGVAAATVAEGHLNYQRMTAAAEISHRNMAQYGVSQAAGGNITDQLAKWTAPQSMSRNIEAQLMETYFGNRALKFSGIGAAIGGTLGSALPVIGTAAGIAGGATLGMAISNWTGGQQAGEMAFNEEVKKQIEEFKQKNAFGFEMIDMQQNILQKTSPLARYIGNERTAELMSSNNMYTVDEKAGLAMRMEAMGRTAGGEDFQRGLYNTRYTDPSGRFSQAMLKYGATPTMSQDTLSAAIGGAGMNWQRDYGRIQMAQNMAADQMQRMGITMDEEQAASLVSSNLARMERVRSEIGATPGVAADVIQRSDQIKQSVYSGDMGMMFTAGLAKSLGITNEIEMANLQARMPGVKNAADLQKAVEDITGQKMDPKTLAKKYQEFSPLKAVESYMGAAYGTIDTKGKSAEQIQAAQARAKRNIDMFLGGDGSREGGAGFRDAGLLDATLPQEKGARQAAIAAAGRPAKTIADEILGGKAGKESVALAEIKTGVEVIMTNLKSGSEEFGRTAGEELKRILEGFNPSSPQKTSPQKAGAKIIQPDNTDKTGGSVKKPAGTR
jgi:hypothetical protein